MTKECHLCGQLFRTAALAISHQKSSKSHCTKAKRVYGLASFAIGNQCRIYRYLNGSRRINISPIDITEDNTPSVDNGPSTIVNAFRDISLLITAQQAMGPPIQSLSPIIHHIGNIQISERDVATLTKKFIYFH